MTEPTGVIDSLLTKDMVFAAFSIGLLYVIYKMVALGDAKSQTHADQIERIYKENDVMQKAKDDAHAQTIERMAKQFTDALDKIMTMAQAERRESNDTLRALTESFNRVIEKRGEIRPFTQNMGLGEK
jgi:hypothetical protein